MKAFTELFTALDETTKTNAKTDALVKYFESASATDAAWAIWFLSGRKLRQVIPSSLKPLSAYQSITGPRRKRFMLKSMLGGKPIRQRAEPV